jgi:hypothetical protein
VGWLENLAVSQEITDHTDVFFANEVVLRLAESLRTIAVALRDSMAEGVILSPAQFRRLYRRLAWTFTAEVTSFERKRFVSLSHEPNKAMNLNSYIGLMGGTYRAAQTPAGLALRWTRTASCSRSTACATCTCWSRKSTAGPPSRRLPTAPSGLGDPDRAHRRRHHRHPAHRAPGAHVLRRDVLGGRQRPHPQARAG